jgi:hypothetical protein
MSSESYEAHWRAAANDAIPYHKDFPEWLTMVIELLNGGKHPTEVSLQLFFHGKKLILKYRDSGYGCRVTEANERLLRWAAVVSVDGKSIYGHGTKKFLAKSGEYTTLNFAIRTRAKGEKKIVEWKGPFKGLDTHMDIVEIEDFPPHGFEVEVEVDIQKVGTYNTPEKVFYALKEIICARKHQSTLSSIKFSLETYDGHSLVKKEDSKTDAWKSFQHTIATHPSCKLLLHKEIPFIEGKVTMVFDSYTTGLLEEVPGFPVYGNMTGGVGTRNHIGNEDTMIEAHPWWDIHDTRVHPSKWHRVEFTAFKPVDPANKDHLQALPEPATTKVAYRYESNAWQHFVKLMRKIHEENKKELALPAKEDLKAPSSRTGSTVSTPVLQSASAVVTPVLQARNLTGALPVVITKTVTTPVMTATSAPALTTSVVKIEATKFENIVLNEKYYELVNEKKSPERYELPKWLDCEDLLIYKEGAVYQCIFYRARQKGNLENDVEKAYVALMRFVNERNLKPTQVAMQFCLHSNNVLKKHSNAFNQTKTAMKPSVYPYIGCLTLTQMTNN